ncbi:MAG: LPS export ABC transporter permease LptG [Chromatiales bacterium]|nr:LPS export ABC transporter permease LptG [Chromatiales bacterium]
MKLAERYIGVTLLNHVLMVLLVLLALYFFSTLVGEMGDVGKGGYNTIEVVRYCLMLIPRQAYEAFPLVMLVGTIVGMGALAGSGELTVLRASGVSIRRLSWAVMKSGLLIIAVAVVVGESIAPYLEKEAHAQRLALLETSISINSGDGLWARDGNDFINIKRLVPGGRANDLTRYRFHNGNLVAIDNATQGVYEQGEWRVGPVLTTLFDEARVRVIHHEEERWPSTLTPEVVKVATMPAENLALWELVDFIGYLRENALASARYETAMWVRVFTPLATAGMILLALPFVFGSLRAVTIGHRIMVGSMTGIVFYLINGIFSRLGVIYDISPLVSAATPTVLVFLLWVYLMRRVY